MINYIGTSQTGQILGTSPLPQADQDNARVRHESDAILQVNFADVINQAKQAAENDAQALRKARELLQCGQLTNPQNIQSAAENILTFGI